jgi:hypothetical protein
MKNFKLLIAILAIALSSCDSNNDESQTKQNPISYTSDEIDMCNFDLINLDTNFTSKPNSVMERYRAWKTGQVIKIKFLDGDNSMQEQVKRHASEWATYANLKFEYVPVTEYADIRIAFTVGTGGAWSYLGTASISTTTLGQKEPSMRFGWNKLEANDNAAKSTILHEFGHALGLKHEQLSPNANIAWNLPKVYKYYGDLGWSKEKIDSQVLNVMDSNPRFTNYSEYDPLSIMHYYIHSSLTTNGIGVQKNNVLSTTDRISINKWYPFPIRSIIESGERIDDIPWTKPITSPNGKYQLKFSIGVLRIIDVTNNEIKWQVGKAFASSDSYCWLDTNGNIIIMGRRSMSVGPGLLWDSGTEGFPGAKLHLQDDGNLILFHDGVQKWSSKSGKL